MQTWTNDAPSSPTVYKYQALSEQLYSAAFEKAEVIQWCTPVSGYGKKKGESVGLFTITGPTEKSSYLLQENVRIPESTVAITGTTITVAEFGNAITHSNLFDELSKYDIKNFIQKRLVQDMKLGLDLHSGAAFKTASVCFTPTSATAATVDTNGTPSVAVAAGVGVTHLQLARDYLYGTLKAPYFGDGGSYIGLFNWAATRSIRTDPLWKEWYVNGHPEKIQTGMIGKIENIDIIETNHDTVLQTVTVSNVAMGQGFVFGDEAVAFAEAVTPELRIKVADDYGRNQGVAWYGVCNWGVIHPNANAREARIIRFSGNNFANP